MSPAIVRSGYGSGDVLSIVGCTYRQLDYWARTGIIEPSVADAEGSGTRRSWSRLDLIALKVGTSMSDRSGPKDWHRMFAALKPHLDAPGLADLYLCHGEEFSGVVDGAGLLAALERATSVVVVLALGRIVAEVDAAIARVGSSESPQ